VVQSVLSPGRRADCESLALELRAEIKLTAAQRLNPSALARHLGIPVRPLDAFAEATPGAVVQLRSEEELHSFSAVTIMFGRRGMIVYHPDHDRRRHVNSVAHEISHIVLGHEPVPLPLFDSEGQRISVRLEEECEADYLAGAILVPRCGVPVAMERCGGDLARAAEHFGIDEGLMEQRRRVYEVDERPSPREVAAMLRMSEEEMGIVRRVAIKPRRLGEWEGSRAA
jgi:Zn-dependent peptidase ImmA (M78 family)